jgi:hypothetical protein
MAVVGCGGNRGKMIIFKTLLQKTKVYTSKIPKIRKHFRKVETKLNFKTTELTTDLFT